MAKPPAPKSASSPAAQDPAVEEARVEILKRELSISRGLMARVAHVSLTTMMMKTITTMVYDILYPA